MYQYEAKRKLCQKYKILFDSSSPLSPYISTRPILCFLTPLYFCQDTKQVKVNIVIDPESNPSSATNSPTRMKRKNTQPAGKHGSLKIEKKISHTKKLKSDIMEKKKSVTSQPTAESDITNYVQTYEDRIKTYEP